MRTHITYNSNFWSPLHLLENYIFINLKSFIYLIENTKLYFKNIDNLENEIKCF